MGSPCLFTRQQALKMGYFYWLRVKSSNHLHTELNLGYLKCIEFCLESKAAFIDISSIASFKPFLIVWLREYCTFSDSSVVDLKSSPWPKNTPSWEPFFKKNHVLLSNFFSSSNMFLIRLFLANTWKKNRESTSSFKRNGEFIPLSSLVWGKSLAFCTCTRSCALADGAKIVRRRYAQCNTKGVITLKNQIHRINIKSNTRKSIIKKYILRMRYTWELKLLKPNSEKNH